ALYGDDALVRTDREEAVPARSAAIGGKMKHAEEPGKGARSMLARNPLEVHVAAQSAVCESEIHNGNSPGIKSRIATPATPRPQQSGADDIVLHTPPAGTTGTVAMTDRQRHFFFSPETPFKRDT